MIYSGFSETGAYFLGLCRLMVFWCWNFLENTQQSA